MPIHIRIFVFGFHTVIDVKRATVIGHVSVVVCDRDRSFQAKVALEHAFECEVPGVRVDIFSNF
jgi:hypothetical protein